MNIRPLHFKDASAVKVFTDRWIGENYYSVEEINEGLEFSKGSSFGAFDGNNLAGVRLSYAPGMWIEKARALTPSKWRVPASHMAYFKSLFIAENFQAKGLGKSLSNRSIEELKKNGAEAILCHSWLESPGNSSQLYLSAMGFEPVNEHAKFWEPIDYLCTRCAPERCQCTAVEMVKYLV